MADYDAPGPLTRQQVIDLRNELQKTNAARNAEYTKLRNLYDGTHWGDDVDNPTPEGGYALVANYVAPTVDRAVTDLFARMPGIQCMPRGVDEESKRLAEGCEGYLYAMWERCNAPEVFRQAAFNAVLYRRGILYMWWDVNEEAVRFRSVSPFNFFPVYDGDMLVEAIFVSRRLTRELKRIYPRMASEITPDEDPETSIPTQGYSDVSGGYTDALGDDGSARERQLQSGYTTVTDWYDRHGNWVRVMGAAVHTQKLSNKLGRVPFFEIKPKLTGDEVEPRSEVQDIAELNQYYDQLLTQHANVIKKYSNPTILDFGTGRGAAEIKRVVAGEGGVLPVKPNSQLRFLNWEGTSPDISMQMDRVENLIHDLSGRPRSAYGETATNQSGVMTNLSMSPTTSLTENRSTMFGMALTQLHSAALCLFEEMAPGKEVSYRGYRPKGRYGRTEYFESPSIKGAEIKGWYKNQLKWPSFIRTDDPMFVQNIISQVTSDPPLLPIYDALEMLGHDDVEALRDRLESELEDPRYHPERLESAIGAIGNMQNMELPTDLEGFDPASPLDPGQLNQAAEASASPYREAL